MDFTVYSSLPRQFGIQNYFDAFGLYSDGVERPVRPIVSLQLARGEDIVFYDEFPREQLKVHYLQWTAIERVAQSTILRFRSYEGKYPEANARVVDHIAKKFYRIDRIEDGDLPGALCTIWITDTIPASIRERHQLAFSTDSPERFLFSEPETLTANLDEDRNLLSPGTGMQSSEEEMNPQSGLTEFEAAHGLPSLTTKALYNTFSPIRKMSYETAYSALLELTSTKSEILSFENYLEQSKLTLLRLLGCGGFGMVLLAKDQEDVLKAVKFIPIKSENVGNILQELRITARLSQVTESQSCIWGYPKYYGSSVVTDRLTEGMKSFLGDNAREEFEQKDQGKWMAIETEFGGDSLSRFASPPAGSMSLEHYGCALSILVQVINILAEGENLAWFEHRDCQWDNILITQDREQESARIEISSFVTKVSLPTFGIKVTLVDFGLSRCSTSNGVLYFDMNRESPDILKQTGTVQYDVYRKMQEILNNSWGAFRAKTNAVWIEYLLEKLLHRVQYKEKSPEKKQPRRKEKPARKMPAKGKHVEKHLPYKKFIEEFQRAVQAHGRHIQRTATGFREFLCAELLRKKVRENKSKK